ncbi:MAG TPA: hypothetical protein IAB42_00290 [Candidatus Coproplasma avistercoris]|nr:hypothetical protein [Candidatus Coproplasma avistercoris]
MQPLNQSKRFSNPGQLQPQPELRDELQPQEERELPQHPERELPQPQFELQFEHIYISFPFVCTFRRKFSLPPVNTLYVQIKFAVPRCCHDRLFPHDIFP